MLKLPEMMRRFISGSVLALVVSVVVQAGPPQAGFFKNIDAGAMGGLSMSRMWGLEAKEKLWKPGGWIGAYILFPVADNLYLRPEVNFTMRGYRYSYANESDLQNDRSSAGLDLNYLDFPLLLQFAVPIDEKLIPEIFLGPVVSRNISAVARTRVGETVTSNEVDNIRKIDLGIVAGARIPYRGRFYINLRGGFGILSIIDVEHPPEKHNLWLSAGGEYCF
ncbi:MAG TPA: hypothetical protein DHW42_08315 [Candidatus Marinimicrobia bacterium]|nr:hypothetical protein [Candidatus Neomarinimicrobiota bacterium]